MDRCIPAVIDDGAAQDADQAVAICSSMWEDAVKGLAGTERACVGAEGVVNGKAYSVLTIKAVDDDRRIIQGIATTPEPDRMGDVVEPLGVQFKNPLPLLHQHDTRNPVGQARFHKPTKGGIEFTATIAKVTEPGPLKDRVDTAWQEVKYGLVRGVSIGFLGKEVSVMKDGGLHFIESEVLELSLVTIPAHQEATISVIKSIDRDPAAIGDATRKSGAPDPKQSRQARRPSMKQTVPEQIAAFTNLRNAKFARMSELMEKAAEASVTLTTEESDEYDDLEIEVKKLDEHLKRLEVMKSQIVVTAKAVDQITNPEAASQARGGYHPVIQVRSPVPPGINLIRMMGARYIARETGQLAADVAKSKGWTDVEMVLRAPVTPGTTTGATFALPLVQAENFVSEFAELLRPSTIIGRIPGLTRVPFNIKIPRETTGASVNWVGEAKVKPVSAIALDQITLAHNKLAGIVPITEELLRFADPSAELLIRNSLAKAIVALMDRDFLDPTKTLQAGVSPASITNGVTPITATGTTSAALIADLGALIALYTASNQNLSGLVLLMTPTQAMRISLMRTSLGTKLFDTVTKDGGVLEGIPVVTSENIVATGGSPANGGLIVAVNAPEILLADDGNVSIDVSREASLQMETTPDSPVVAGTVLVSLWQHNMVGIKAERFITWLKRRPEAVQFIQYAKYTG